MLWPVADVRAAAAAVQQMIAELHDRSVDAALRRGCGQGDVHFLELIVDICHKKKHLSFFSDAAETEAAAVERCSAAGVADCEATCLYSQQRAAKAQHQRHADQDTKGGMCNGLACQLPFGVVLFCQHGRQAACRAGGQNQDRHAQGAVQRQEVQRRQEAPAGTRRTAGP